MAAWRFLTILIAVFALFSIKSKSQIYPNQTFPQQVYEVGGILSINHTQTFANPSHGFCNLTNFTNNNKNCWSATLVTTSSTGIINTNAFAAEIYTPPDNGGETSGVYVRQDGGGNAASFFNLCSAYQSISSSISTQYCNNGTGVEVAVDGTKIGIGSSIWNGGTGEALRLVRDGSGGTSASANPLAEFDAKQNGITFPFLIIDNSGIGAGTGSSIQFRNNNLLTSYIQWKYDGSAQTLQLGAGGGGPSLIIDNHSTASHMQFFGGTSPALSACGTTPTLSGDDVHGTITEGTTATGCTLTFNVAYEATPTCVVSSPNGIIPTSYAVTTTTLVITNASASGDKFSYICLQ